MRKGIKDLFSTIITTNDGIRRYHYYENPILSKNGEEVVIVWNNRLLESEDGKIFGTISTGINITERKILDTIKKKFEDKLSSINYFTSTLNSAKSVKEVYEHVVDGLTKMLEYEYAVFIAVEKNILRIKTFRGLKPIIGEIPLNSQKGLTVKA